jgi:hypothetical protein
MNLQQFTQKLTNYNEHSRVWIYQADSILTDNEVAKIEAEMNPFVTSWAHHGQPLKANFGVLYHLFIVIVVDETVAEVGGCGIDSSVHIVQKISKDLAIDFFDRLAIAFFNKEKVECIDKTCFAELIANDENWQSTNLVFNNQVKTLGELKTNWIIPFKNSWHNSFFTNNTPFHLSL